MDFNKLLSVRYFNKLYNMKFAILSFQPNVIKNKEYVLSKLMYKNIFLYFEIDKTKK